MEETKLVKWLDTIQTYLDIYGSGGSSFVESMKQLWMDEMELLSDNKNVRPISVDLQQSSEEFKFMLSRVVLPRLLERFRHVLGNIHNKELRISSDLNDCSFQNNLNYCCEVEEPDKDIVTLLCALSDFMGRIQHSFSADNKQLTKIQSKETKVFQRVSHSQEIRASKLRILKGIDEDKIIFKACDGLTIDIKNAKNDLDIAIFEEEEAKKAYERAMAKTKSIREKISQLESVSSIIENQRSLLISVNEKCENEDAVVKIIAENRINLVTTLQNTFQDLWSNKIKETVYSTMASSFQTLWNQFKASSKLNTFHLRIGREILTLWKKQMTSDNPTSSLLTNCLEELDNDIDNNNQISSPNKVTKNTTDIANNVFVSSTVVLYNTLDYHETPVDIVESQARTKTAIEIILQQFHKSQQHTVKLTESQDKQRSLALKECNNVTSVPLYCLPLVHSAQYLHRLYTFAKEANDEDLYVPLEFDTEWETEVEYFESDSDNSLDMEVIRGRPPRTMKLKKLDEERLQSVLQHRLPNYKIHELAKVMNPSRRESRLASKLSFSTKLSSAEDNDHSNVLEDTAFSSSRNHQYNVGQRVQTLFGDGVIIAEENVSGNPAIHTVLLLWGAKAFLNESCFVNPPTETTVLSPSLEIKREKTRANRLSVGKTMKPKQLKKSSSSIDKTLPNAMGNRFDVTDFHLHKLIRRILNIVQSNRFLVENIPLRDAFFSLWLHGRTHGASNQNFETSIRNWLKKYDPEELHKLLCNYESILATAKGDISVIEDFVADFKKLPVDNRRQKLTIYGNEEDLKKSAAELRQEAWDFSYSKILNRRGSMLRTNSKTSLVVKQEEDNDDNDEENNDDDEVANMKASEPHNKRRRKMKKVEAEHGSFQTSVSKYDNTEEIKGTPKKRQREKRVVYHNPVLRSDLQPAPNDCYRTEEERVFNEDIRFLCARLCQKLKLSQTDMVTELVSNFDIQVAQGNISSWMRHKMGLNAMHRLSEVIVQWMESREDEFLPEDQLLLENVKVRLFSSCAPQGRVNHIASKHETYNGNNVTRLSQTNENINDESTINDNMKDHIDDIDKITEKIDDDSGDDIDVGSEDDEGAHDVIDQDQDSVPATDPADANDRRVADISDASSDEDVFSGSLHCSSTRHKGVYSRGKKVRKEKYEHQYDSGNDLESEAMLYSVRDGIYEHEESGGLGKKKVFDIINTISSDNDSPTTKNSAGAEAADETKMEVVDDIEVQENNFDTMETDHIVEPTNTIDPVTNYTQKMIRKLLDSFVNEINRRKLTHAYIEGEAWRMGISIIIQPTISKFLRTQDAPYVRQRRDEFCKGVAKWLEYSKSRPPPYLKDHAGHDTKDLFCSECNVFTSRHCRTIREFLEHLVVCGKPANATTAAAAAAKYSHIKKEKQITSNEGEQVDVEERDNEENENMQSKIPANDFSYFCELSHNEIQRAEDKLASHQMVIQLYPYPNGMRYPICGHCGVCIANGNHSTNNVLGCSSCPVQYHAHCRKDSSAAMKEDSWYCPTCEENGAAETIEIPEDLKRAYITPNMYIYCFFPEYRCWKAGHFVSIHSQQAHLGLVRFDRPLPVGVDQEEDPLQWINLDLSIIRIPQERYSKTHFTRKKRKFSSMLNVNERRPRLRSSFQKQVMSSTANTIARGKPSSKGAVDNSHSSNNHNNNSSCNDHVLHKDKHSTPTKRGRPRSVRPVVESPPNESSPSSGIKSNHHTVSTVADKTSDGMTDTYISATTMQAALASAGIACKAVDVVMQNVDVNAFACIRPPGHHAGRHGCTPGCLSTGFCILNNAALALVYARVTYGLRKIAVVDFDVHFGNGTADILRGDPNAFFASVHMVYGAKNDGQFDQTSEKVGGFYPAQLGCTDIPTENHDDNYICIGVQPENISRFVRKSSLRHKTKAREDAVKALIDNILVTTGAATAVLDSNDTIGESESVPTRQEKTIGDSAIVVQEGGEEDDESDMESMIDVDVDASTEEHAMDVDAQLENGTSEQQGVSFSKDTMKDIPTEFVGSRGFLDALKYVIIPKMVAFGPELLIISAGFDGYRTDPIGGALHLSLDDYSVCTTMLMNAMKEVSQLSQDPQRESRIVSLLEGGYDTSPVTLGLAKCVECHVTTLRNKLTDNL